MNWIIAHPDAATALATMALVSVGLVIGAGQIAAVWYGISRMVRAGDAREREQERRHKETMDAFAERRRQSEERKEANELRHKETMDAFAERRRQSEERKEANELRHKETMDAFAERRRQSEERKEANELRRKEAMEAGEHRHREAMETLAAQRRALEALIERTAPPPASAK